MDNRKPFMAEIQAARRTRGNVEPLPVEKPRRGPETDLQQVLAAVATVEAKLDGVLKDHRTVDLLHKEIAALATRLDAIKSELAEIRHPLAADDRFRHASQALTEVVQATEQATNTIMSNAEGLEQSLAGLRAAGVMPEILDEMAARITAIYEACNFQDLTGQRINRVVQVLDFVEARIDAMTGLWDRAEFEALPLPQSLVKKDDGLELFGPENAGATISQADIDKLFD
jgi:chemotaxis protein CheZ